MNLLEFILCQSHLASQIFSHLELHDILRLANVNDLFYDFVIDYLDQMDAFDVRFSEFRTTYQDLLKDLLETKTNMKTLRIIMDGCEDPGAAAALSKLIIQNKMLQYLQVRMYMQGPPKLLQAITKLSELQVLDITANGFGNPTSESLGGFYAALSKNCKMLKHMVINRFVDDVSLNFIASMKLLSIDVFNSDLTDAAVCKFLSSNHQLIRLHLNNTMISNQSIVSVAENCKKLKDFVVADPEEMAGLNGLSDVISQCQNLSRFKFLSEDWELLMQYDSESLIFQYRFSDYEIEELFCSVEWRLPDVQRLRITGRSLSRKLLNLIRIECHSLKEIVVNMENTGARFDSHWTESDQSGFVVDVCEMNLNLERFDFEANHINKAACEMLVQEDRKIKYVRLKLEDELSTDCKEILERRFHNSSQMSSVYVGKRK